MLLDQTKFDSTLKTTSKNSTDFKKNMQKLCVTAIGHALVHGNVSFVQAIVTTFKGDKGVTASKAIAYMQHWAPVSIDKDSVTYDRDRSAERIDIDNVVEIKDLFEALDAMKWYEFKKEAEIKNIDVAKELQKLIEKVAAVEKAGKIVENRALLSIALDAIKNAKDANAREVLKQAA